MDLNTIQGFSAAGTLGRAAKAIKTAIGDYFKPEIQDADHHHKKLLNKVRDLQRKFDEVEAESKTALAAAHQQHPEFKAEGVGFRTVFVPEIYDESQLPREYLRPDHDKIKGIVTALGMETKIPGVRVMTATQVSMRTE